MNKIISTIFATGSVLALGGLLTYLFYWPLAPYFYLIGTTMIAIALVFMRDKSEDPVVRRLSMQQLWGGLLLFVSGVLMIVMHSNEWILALAIACVFLLYSSFRMSYIEKKKNKK